MLHKGFTRNTTSPTNQLQRAGMSLTREETRITYDKYKKRGRKEKSIKSKVVKTRRHARTLESSKMDPKKSNAACPACILKANWRPRCEEEEADQEEKGNRM